MVKCRSLIWKYLNSEQVLVLTNNSYKFKKRKQNRNKSYMAKPIKSEFRPAWREQCDAWVDERLEVREGATTPVHVLYNTFLMENPKHYMDIAQFGKVMKSRFKNQKCRRGGQGAQIYVYKDVAIKTRPEDKFSDFAHPSMTPDLRHTYTLPLPEAGLTYTTTHTPPPPDLRHTYTLPLPELRHTYTPPQSEGWDTSLHVPSMTEDQSNVVWQRVSPPPLTTSTLLDTTVTSAADVSLYTSPHAKRKVGHESLIVPHPKKRKLLQEDFHRVEEETELCVDRSATLYSPQGAAVLPLSEHAGRSDAVGSSHNNEYLRGSGGTIQVCKDLYAQRLCDEPQIGNETTQMPPVNFYQYIDGNTTMLGNESRYSSSPNVLDESCQQTEPEDLSVKSTRSPKNIPAHSEEKRPIPMEAEAETQQCRMAVGRQWVDANIVDVAGARTSAWEVMAAYTRDHPDQPLPETSLAMLIRNKFPSRRKALREGFNTIYYFQDLDLMNREGLGPRQSWLNTTDDKMPKTSEACATPPTLIRTENNGQPVEVYNPPAERIFMVGDVPCVALRMTTYPEPQSGARVSPAPGVSYEVLSLPEIPKTVIQAKAEDTANVQSRIPSPGQPKPNDVKVIQDSRLEEHQDAPSQVMSSPSLPEVKCEDMNVTEYLDDESKEVAEDSTQNVESAKVESDVSHEDKLKETPKVEEHKDIVQTKQEKLDVSENDSEEEGKSERKSSDSVNDKSKSTIWDADMRKYACAANNAVAEHSRKVKLKPKRKPSLKRLKLNQTMKENQNSSQGAKPECKSESNKEAECEDKASVAVTTPEKELIKKSVLDTVFRLLSKEGASLSEQERARMLESSLYERNPAVVYDATQLSEFTCCASPALMDAATRLTAGDATQLLCHHQRCPGQGCSYNGYLCCVLRAAYVHVSIFRHRCPVWKAFTRIVERHSQECRDSQCTVRFCLFMKHEQHLAKRSPLSLMDAKQRDLTKAEFDRCEREGRHGADLTCKHLSPVQLPLPVGTPDGAVGEVESRSLAVAGRILVGETNTDMTPLLHTMHIAALMQGSRSEKHL